MTFEELMKNENFLKFITIHREELPLFKFICNNFKEVIPLRNGIKIKHDNFFFEPTYQNVNDHTIGIDYIPMIAEILNDEDRYFLVKHLCRDDLGSNLPLISFIRNLSMADTKHFIQAIKEFETTDLFTKNLDYYSLSYGYYLSSCEKYITFPFVFQEGKIQNGLRWFDLSFDYAKQIIFREKLL